MLKGENGQAVVFNDTRLPADNATLAMQVQHALGLGLPVLRDFEYPWNGALRVVGNGPSARKAPLDGKTLAINGALKLFVEQGLAPTYWIACDPQELVVDFLAEMPEQTIYLVASKCHPKVFERLKDRKVVIWHVGDLATLPLVGDRFPATPFNSITSCAFEIMARLGWRNFDVWGWDCCVMAGAENAVVQDNGAQTYLDVTSRGRTYRTTGTWLHEAHDALSMLKGFPFKVTFHGSGFMGAFARDFLPMKIEAEE